MSGKYDDIIDLPHHRSTKHPHMSMLDRAAQFSPFAALTGHSAAMDETARLTDQRVELDEVEIQRLDEALRHLREHIKEQPAAAITWFVPDTLKAGGAYVTTVGRVKKHDELGQTITVEDGTVIPIREIIEIELKLFFEMRPERSRHF